MTITTESSRNPEKQRIFDNSTHEVLLPMTTETKEAIIRKSLEIINAADKIEKDHCVFVTFSNGVLTGRFLMDGWHRGPERVMPDFLSYYAFAIVGEKIGEAMARKVGELAAQEERRKIRDFIEEKAL